MKLVKYLILISILFAISACKTVTLVEPASGVDLLATEENIYTLVNLHPDEIHAKLYSVNYQREGLIAACSKVDLVSLSSERLTFTLVSSGKTYTLDKHKSSPDFPAYVQKYFGSQCVTSDIKKLSSTDRQGIEKGVATKGMTKQGVIYAIGYPPEHRTPSNDGNEWIYWINRFKTMAVVFDSKGKVTEVGK
ncbi:MAG: outer membrane protein assembly factor BamE [Planctomycetes bacterium]|nr:outer membrane protein assembly factor BamE [Planctomycetota bacterium]